MTRAMTPSEGRGRSQPRLWIHVGLPKTGSSALQSTFVRSRAAVRAAGVDYPDVGEFGGGHVHLAWPLLSEERRARPDVLDPSSPDRARLLWADLGHEVRARGCADALISSEYFSEVAPAVLADHARLVTGDAHVLIYLRSQDDLIESGYLQEVKAGLTSASFGFGGYTPALDYAKVLAGWSDAFGQDHVHARIYDRSVARRGVVADAAEVIGLDPSTLAGVDQLSNPSIHPALVGLQRVANLVGIPKARLVPLVAERLEAGGAPARGLAFLTPAERAEILDAFADSNAAVARSYFGRPDGQLFEQVQEQRTVAPRGVSDEVLAAAVLLLSEQVEALGREIRGDAEPPD